MRYARLPSGGSEGLALKQKHRKQATHHHTDNDKGTGETVVSQQIKIMAEYALLTMIKTEQHGLDSAVGINTGYHGQQSRKETGFRRALGTRCDPHGQHADNKSGQSAGRNDVDSHRRQHQHITQRMADSGQKSTIRIGPPGRIADTGKPTAATAAKKRPEIFPHT